MVRMRVSSPLLHFLATTLVLVLLCGTGWGFGGFTVTPASLVSGGQHAQLNVQGGGLNNVVLVYFLPIGSAGSPTGTAITVDSYRSVSNTLLMMDVTVRPRERLCALQSRLHRPKIRFVRAFFGYPPHNSCLHKKPLRPQ